jgi:hypothetical protein
LRSQLWVRVALQADAHLTPRPATSRPRPKINVPKVSFAKAAAVSSLHARVDADTEPELPEDFVVDIRRASGTETGAAKLSRVGNLDRQFRVRFVAPGKSPHKITPPGDNFP